MSPIERVQELSEAQSILGVSASASRMEIRNAWKKLAFENHPDRTGGSDKVLADINAAYHLLSQTADQVGEPANSNNVTPIRPATVRPRPGLRTREVIIDDVTYDVCARFLENNAPKPDSDGAMPTDHVAVKVQMIGRKLCFFVATPLSSGRNRVSLPADLLTGVRTTTPKIVTFRTREEGKGPIRIPADLRKKVFPGASEVEIHFAHTV